MSLARTAISIETTRRSKLSITSPDVPVGCADEMPSATTALNAYRVAQLHEEVHVHVHSNVHRANMHCTIVSMTLTTFLSTDINDQRAHSLPSYI